MTKRYFTYNPFIKRILIILILALNISSLYSQTYSEYDVKGAYVYNFFKFINWPENNNETNNNSIIIGVYKDQAFGEILEEILQDKKIKGKYWEIKFMYSIDDISACNLLFISNTSGKETMQVLNKLKNMPTLTVGNNIYNFCQYGGIINFTKKGYRKRFEINNGSAKKHKLIISSKLLSLAKIIQTN